MLQLLTKGTAFMPRILIGSDHGGFRLKNEIIEHIKAQGFEVEDFGTHTPESCDYPVYAKKVAKEVALSGDKGILVCGTGIGMSIAANKVQGIRAALCSDTFSARMTRMHNDSNILCLGERVIGTGLALDIVDVWLKTEFQGGRHQKRIDMI